MNDGTCTSTGTCGSVNSIAIQDANIQDGNVQANAHGNPTYVFRTNFDYDNRSLVMNSRREMIIKKNSREFRGDSGLKIIPQAVPQQQGLKSYMSGGGGGAASSAME